MLTREGIDAQLRAQAALIEGGSIAVGTSSADESADHTELQGEQVASKPIDEILIDPDNALVIARVTFDGTEANFEWRERGVFDADGAMHERVVIDQGRKAAGTVWIAEARIYVEDAPGPQILGG